MGEVNFVAERFGFGYGGAVHTVSGFEEELCKI
jgi:hypothetical protein